MKSLIPIIGAGPAGLSCALWLVKLGLQPIILERETRAGGMQIVSPYINDWLIGYQGQTGSEIVQSFLDHLQTYNVELQCDVGEIQLLERIEGEYLLQYAGEEVMARQIVFATGTSLRGIEELSDISGALECHSQGYISDRFESMQEIQSMGERSRVIAFLGAGDNAYEGALDYGCAGAQVYILQRSEPRAQMQFQKQAQEHSNIKIINYNSLNSFEIDSNRLIINLDGQKIVVDYLLLRLGYRPNNSLLKQYLPKVSIDALGYIDVNSNTMESNLSGIYAIGDLSQPENPSVVTAISSGAIAAKHIAYN